MADEYISREAAIAAAFSATSLGNSAFRDVYDTVNRLRLIPAADVQPVRHGRWIYNEKSMAVCSICGNVVAFVSRPDSKWGFGHYCPNCGCKMDGGEE